MEADRPADDLQRQVLQSTLDEIATRQEDATDCCVICLESITEVCEAVPCQHRNFDYLCLLSWLEQSPKCPLCKAVISQVRHALDEPVAKTYTVPKPIPEAQTQHSDTRPYAPSSIRRQLPPRRRPYPRRSRYETPSLNPSDEIARRRDVYRHNRYSKHVGSNRLSRYRELNPSAFCTDNELVSRARMWIRRELQVFSFLTADTDDTETRPEDSSSRTAGERRRANNAEFLLEYIIAVLKSVDIMGSAGQAEEMIADFLGRDNTRLFLHELRAWLRSPYTKLADWDRAVQYDVSATGSPRAESERDGNPNPVCPWCYIGALRLTRAIALYLKTVSSSDTIITKWHAYQLNPNTKTQPLVSKMASQWGEEQVPAVKARLSDIAKRAGLVFNFNSTIGNTRDAHRLEKLGRKYGLETEVALEVMKMYFEEGGDITRKEDLADAAERAGVDRDEATVWLEGDDGGEEVDAEVLEMQRKGIKGVPRYIINEKFTVDGAEDVGEILQHLVLAREEALAEESQ
ncbi:hypothetical protein FSARC_12059 [Fusarium sarcochroum]|uniref:RING-type E3 ubiquitin transferase n=1 Tax=Fusarium sarcochroum TaxID=1208366 RepID=A0A8H4WYJ4_9HYPO|nr:hypothetical protein FSARC_12059 [Fusarium sarcochroum]